MDFSVLLVKTLGAENWHSFKICTPKEIPYQSRASNSTSTVGFQLNCMHLVKAPI